MDSKKCGRCGKNKVVGQFHYKSKKNNTRSSWCKICMSDNKKQWYKNNRERLRGLATVWAKKRKINVQQQLLTYLASHPCIDCGEDNPIVLDFDHTDPSIKIKSLSGMLTYSDKTIAKEINKCEVRCSNCHRIRHAKEDGWYSWLKGDTLDKWLSPLPAK